MSDRLTCAALLLTVLGLSPVPAAAQGPAQSYEFGLKRFRHACPPPLKYAAGACVRHCPAGYRRVAPGYCRIRQGGW
ncbi:hypothetical protein [Methylobacterium nonmethylotrophicum]|uniref:Uncharacterized protein n=1 Tax=Methylobacterium nonmethylotrophicum TaxID=1141884 RepID=A0A4Z0NSN6_9HYPH|nr:hypothetical protein [Methylobacterium nonmethylotrophicum]TGD99659.1 hypothetical protein EU555_10755 [Methylobacterium nonmethylotrophicum]